MPRSASIRYHLAQIAELCRSHPLATKVVFVPSRQIGHNVGNALAREGISWVNLRLTTPVDWAGKLAEPKLRAEGWRPLVPDADHFFMLDAVKCIEWPNGHPFGRGYSADGLARSFLKTARALRIASIPPTELASAEIVLPGRRVFIDLYARYCRWLEEERRYDDARLFVEAQQTGHAPDIVAVFDETPLTEAAFQYIESMGTAVVRIGRRSYGRQGPQHSAAGRFERAALGNGQGSVGPGGRAYTDGIDTSDRELLAVREAVGYENEVRGVLREFIQRGVKLDQIEIAYASEDPYLPLLVEITEHLDISATFAAGVPVTLTRPGQAVIGFYRWIAQGFHPTEIVRLLRSRLLYVPHSHGQDDDGEVTSPLPDVIDPPEIAQFMLEARVAPGRTSWTSACARAESQIERELSNDSSEARRRYMERRLAVVRCTSALLEGLYDVVPRSNQTSAGELADAGAAFLMAFGRKQTVRDQRSGESLVDRLRKLSESVAVDGDLSDLAASMVDLISRHKVEAAVARPGQIYIVPLERAGYSGREEVAILGLSESTFPGAAIEDPILLDEERTRISGRLVLQRVKASEPSFHLIRAMGMSSGRVTLTANRHDITEGRGTYPAAMFELIKEQLGVTDAPVYRVIPDAGMALTGDEVTMAMRTTGSISEPILNERPWLARGLEAVRNRAAASLGQHDGWLGRETPELRPTSAKAISPSRLEELAACPHKYFLRNVLGVRPPDVVEETPGRWLTPLEFGSLLHEVLRSFMERVSSRGEALDVDRHTEEMSEVLSEALSRCRERLPVKYETGYQMDVRRLERATQIFLAEEARRMVTPVGFEVSFGLGKSGELDVPDPVCIVLGENTQLLLRGSIDRVDRTDDGYEVWDYKSGSTYDYDETDLLAGGRRLQWALYAYVLDELLARAGIHGVTRRSGYFFPSDREHGFRLADQPPTRAALGSKLAPLFDLVEQGAFLHVQKHKACTFCDYNSICARERREKKDLEETIADEGDRPFYGAVASWLDA